MRVDPNYSPGLTLPLPGEMLRLRAKLTTLYKADNPYTLLPLCFAPLLFILNLFLFFDFFDGSGLFFSHLLCFVSWLDRRHC